MSERRQRKSKLVVRDGKIIVAAVPSRFPETTADLREPLVNRSQVCPPPYVVLSFWHSRSQDFQT